MSAPTEDRPIKKELVMTFTAMPLSGTPRVVSPGFISMPGTFEMPLWEKSGGSVNTISTL